MPRDVLVQMFDAALTSGAMSAKSVVQAATPELLSRHVATPVLWGCLAASAARAKLADADGKPDDAAREFLRRALDAGLKFGVLTPQQVVHHVNAKVLATSLPDPLTTKLLEVSLASGKLTPEIVVETIGVEAIAKHAPAPVVWACLAQAGEAASPPREEPKPIPAPPAPRVIDPFAGGTLPPPKAEPAKPSLDFFDDEVSSVIVELDEAVTEQPVMLAKAPDKKDPLPPLRKR